MFVIASVSSGSSPRHAAAHLAELAQDEEVVAVCGYATAAPLIAGLRLELARFQVLGLVVDPPTAAEATLIESLLATGSIPIAVTAPERVPQVAGWLADRLPGAVHHPVDRSLGTPVL
jgi:hypothetical protein